MSLKLINLGVEINHKPILKNINLEINDGDVVAIMGPNGHGKSTLLKSIMKHYDTTISQGEIKLDEEIINDLTTDEIARRGIYFAMQYPVEIPGLGMLELLRNEASKGENKVSVIELYKIVSKKLKDLNMNPDLLNRNINENFSGGERKKNEILQMQVINPKYIMLDEIDSGLDIDAIDTINQVLSQEKADNKTIIYISHDNKLHSILKPNKVVLIINGEIVEIGDYTLAQEINKIGYQNYAKSKGYKINEDQIENDDSFDLKATNKGFSCNGKN